MNLLLDTQVHIWRSESPQRPWPAGGAELATRVHGRAEFSVEELLTRMRAEGVGRAILVPPFFEGFRNDYVLHAATQRPDTFRVMARLDLKKPDADELASVLLDNPLVVGLRFVFLPADLDRLEDWLDHGVWFKLAQRGLPAAMHAPAQLSAVRTLAQQHPSMQIWLDHAGLSGDPRMLQAELDSLEVLQDVENVSVKYSALSCSLPIENAERVAALGRLRSLSHQFGDQRVLWGSDLTRIRGGYAESRATIREVLGTDRDFTAIMGGNAAATVGWH